LELKADGVYGKGILASKVLHCPGEESLRKEESADPVDRRSALLRPLLNELHSLLQVIRPAA